MAKMYTGRQYREHAHLLAEHHAVALFDTPELDAHPDAATACRCSYRHADVATIVDEQTYVTALHEIGHIVTGHTNRDALLHDSNTDELQREYAAWNWAQANVLGGTWTPEMEAVKIWGLHSYEKSGTVPPWPFACPEPSPPDPFARLLLLPLPEELVVGLLMEILALLQEQERKSRKATP